ncbi:Putative conjugative transposon mobilization protein [Mucinivorans hirudinis]|uniref:Putative conjugative transposon mobilization protein n=1 Tax=Mucinivorans hirudinis TaxID=1433126 RepID=A0A060RAC1_9BACT|nr:Putative conjugative transposon mobilization protein [Mucinivorans hirudinis]
MVAKISVSGSLAGAVNYNMNKLKADTAQILLTNKMLCPEPNEVFKANDMIKDFELFMPQRYRTENPVFHVSLNPHPDDKLSDMELSLVAEEYMKRMGYGSQPYVVFKHQDISRHHIHIVSVRVNEKGKKINDKFERRRSKDITRSLEQKYGLHTAEKVSKEKKPELKMVDVSQGNAKEQVENVVREVINKYHFLTFTEYKAVLTKFNIAAEEVKGSHYGSPFSGIVYSATDTDDNKVGNPFSSATLGKFAGSEALERKYQASKEHLEKSRPAAPLKRAINQAFAGATNKEQLRYNLFQSGVGVVYRENAAGRLYGVTFIDHNTGAVLNGSRLGKEYAANAIVDRLENPQRYEHLTNSPQSNDPISRSSQASLQPPYPTQEAQPIHRTEQHYESSSIDDSIGSLFDIPILPNTTDSEEDEFRRRMQRKKRKRSFGL